MKKARLPFQVLSLDGELLVEEEKDLEYRFKERKWTRHQKRKASKRRCWHRNKSKYHDAAKARASTLRGMYNDARRKALYRGQEWELTYEEWQQIWKDAGFVVVPGTITPSNPRGERRTAFFMRGANKHDNTFMARKYPGMPWSVDNCYICFRGEPLSESPYYASEL